VESTPCASDIIEGTSKMLQRLSVLMGKAVLARFTTVDGLASAEVDATEETPKLNRTTFSESLVLQLF